MLELFEFRGSSRIVRVSSDCELTFDRYSISLSCNDNLPGKNDKGKNDISLGVSDKSLEADDKSLEANDKSLKFPDFIINKDHPLPTI